MFTCLYFIIGAGLGSFACLISSRLNTGETPWSPCRSYCDFCHRRLRFWQLIPVLGWLLQGGHCHYCHAPISPFLPLAETGAGLAAASLCDYQLAPALAFMIIITSLVILASSDYFHHLIFPVFILGLCPLFFLYRPRWLVLDILFALGELALFSLLTFHYKSLGCGDWEFLLMTELTLGWFNTALLTLIASLFSVLCFFRIRIIPLMPGLALGTVTTLAWLKQTGALP